MKKSCLILLLAMFLASCSKYEPLHFERTPYDRNELRTDGFWYHVNHSQYDWLSDWMNLYFLYRDGTFLNATAVHTTNPSVITIDSISRHDYNKQNHWGLFEVEEGALKWSTWDWPGGYASLISFEIINDTCLQKEGDKDSCYYYFHPFDYKPDSTIARQWIP